MKPLATTAGVGASAAGQCLGADWARDMELRRAPHAARACAVATPERRAPAASGGGAASLPRLLAEASIEEGAEAFRVCGRRHRLEPGMQRVAPSLHGVFGRQMSGAAGFGHSEAPADLSGVWDAPALAG